MALGLAITDDGTVVGTVHDPARGQYLPAAPNAVWVPYAWRPDRTGVRLSLPDGMAATQTAVADGDGPWAFGHAVSIADPGAERAVRWDLRTGAVRVLLAEPSHAAAGNSDGATVVNAGQGISVVDADGAAHRLPLPQGRDVTAQALAISDDGRTVTGYTSVDGRRGLTIWACE